MNTEIENKKKIFKQNYNQNEINKIVHEDVHISPVPLFVNHIYKMAKINLR